MRQRLQKACQLLNRLAREELEDDFEDNADDRLSRGDIEDLEILPSVANVPYRGTRTLSIYAPLDIIKNNIRDPVARVSTDNMLVPLLREGADGKSPAQELSVILHRHPKYPDQYFYGWLEIRGDLDGQTAKIGCSIGDVVGKGATVTVAPPSKAGKRKTKPPRTGGMFADIQPDADPMPYQRVS